MDGWGAATLGGVAGVVRAGAGVAAGVVGVAVAVGGVVDGADPGGSAWPEDLSGPAAVGAAAVEPDGAVPVAGADAAGPPAGDEAVPPDPGEKLLES